MGQEATNARLIASAIQKRIEKGVRFGLLARSLPPFDPPVLYKVFEPILNDIRLALIGFEKTGLLSDEVAKNVETAVAWRNDTDIVSPLIVILNPNVRQDKIHSLELLEPFTDGDLRQAICWRARSEAQAEDNQLKCLLWHELGLKQTAKYLPLVARQVADLYHGLINGDVSEAFTYIGLLPDPGLIDLDKPTEHFRKRLKENKRQVEWLLELDSKDQRTLARALSEDSAPWHRQTFRKIKQYSQHPSRERLGQLTLDEVMGIRQAQKASESTPEASREQESVAVKISQQPPEVYIVDQILSLDTDRVDGQEKLADFERQAERISEMFYEDLNEDYETDVAQGGLVYGTQRDKDRVDEHYEVLIDHRSQEEVASIKLPAAENELHPLDEYMGIWVHPQCWGGHIHIEELPKGVVDIPDLFIGNTALHFTSPLKPFDSQSDGSLINLFAALDKQVTDLTNTDNLVDLFKDLYEHRRYLAKYRKLFLYFPIWAVQDPKLRQAVQEYVETYYRLSKQLQQVCRQLQTTHPDAVRRATAQFLALDTVIIDFPLHRESTTSVSVLLTTLHPLHLWKWFELGKMIRESREELNGKELTKFTAAVGALPTLLNTFLVHEQMFSPPRRLLETRLVLAGEINNREAESTVSIPYYKPVAHQRSTTDGLAQFSDLLPKFFSLYPPARLGLTLVLIDPPQLSPMLNKLVKLHNDNLLHGAKVYVYRTNEQAAAHDVWQSKDDEALQLFREDPRWNLSVSLDCDTLAKIGDDLKTRGLYPHLVLICDPSEAVVESIFRIAQEDATPFGVPVQLTYDSISDTIKLVPTPSGDIFNVYAGLRNVLSGELQRSVMGVGNRSANLQYLRLLLNEEYGTSWLAIIDWPQGTFELPSNVGQRLAWQSAGSRTVAIHTNERDWQKYWLQQLKQKLNSLHLPRSIQTDDILSRLLELFPILPDGLISLIKDKESSEYDVFDQDTLGQLLSVIIVLNWYRQYRAGLVIIPIGGLDFADWYEPQSIKLASDYLALWLDEDQLHADVLTIHTVKGTFDEVPPLSTARPALEALAQFAGTFEALFNPGYQLLMAPLRRALLRERLTMAVFAASQPKTQFILSQSRHTKTQWAMAINDLFAAAYKPYVRLLDVRVAVQEERQLADEQSYRHENDNYSRVIVKLPATYLCSAEDTVAVKRETPSEARATSDFLQEQPVDQEQKQTETISSDLLYQPKPLPPEDVAEQAEQLRRVLIAYGIAIEGIDVEKSQIGPRFVRYWVKLKPPSGRLGEVQRYAEDIARELGSKTVPFIDNIPGERYIGIDLAREEPDIVPLAPSLVLLPVEQANQLMIAMGQNPAGEAIQLDLVRLPHMLVAGQTGSGKTVFLSTLITSLVSRHPRDELELVLVDPKQMDFGIFGELPHLRNGHIIYEPEEAVAVLRELIRHEKDRRTQILRSSRCPNILEYNRRSPERRLLWTVVVIDEFADIILSLSKKERSVFERQINRMAATGRALGIHLVIATQRPTIDVVTGTIKANIPARISFRLPALIDSRTILDRTGAEKLLGNGDMLVAVNSEVQRLQGYYASYDEFISLLDIYKE